MKRNLRLVLCLLLFFTLIFPLNGFVDAAGSSSSPSLRVSINLNTLKSGQDGQASLQDTLYETFYQQVKQQLGSCYTEQTLEQIARSLADIMLPRLEDRPSQPSPEPEPEPEPEPQPELEPEPGDPSFAVSRDETVMLDLLNQERQKAGLQPLELHKELTEVARLKAEDMIENNYFAHQSPTYGSPFDMMRQAGIRYSYAGENLAGSPTVERAHQALMNSPGHRANILNRNFTHVGIGAVDGGVYGKIFVQMFIRQ